MLDFAAAQHLGPREEQQDHVFVEPGLAVVADGNGVLGDCSADATKMFRKHLREARELGVPLHEAIEKAIRCADEELSSYIRNEIKAVLQSWRPDDRAMEAVEALGPEFFEHELSSGTTFVAFVEDELIAHVGDSRAYRVVPAKNEITLLTEDHVWTPDAETVDVDGTIYKHGLAIARVLGHPGLKVKGVTAEPVLTPFTLGDGEFLLLCSDGLRPFLERANGDSRLCALLKSGSLQDAAKEAIEAASRVATDNVSLILVGR
jgi:serine/threonine protein phosphatase PrpC